jgi:hypothetical protein
MEFQFSWRKDKEERNLRKHHLNFEKAQQAFSDPLHVSIQDRVVDGEERWQTLGVVEGQTLLLVAHTLREGDVIHVHIISARKATKHERRFYEYQSR